MEHVGRGLLLTLLRWKLLPSQHPHPKGNLGRSRCHGGADDPAEPERVVGRSPGLSGTGPPSVGRHKLTISKSSIKLEFHQIPRNSCSGDQPPMSPILSTPQPWTGLGWGRKAHGNPRPKCYTEGGLRHEGSWPNLGKQFFLHTPCVKSHSWD